MGGGGLPWAAVMHEPPLLIDLSLCRINLGFKFPLLWAELGLTGRRRWLLGGEGKPGDQVVCVTRCQPLPACHLLRCGDL